ncbi:DUF967 domain protein [Cordyceps fumosorosea ARSEF 2679]|uniref:DUF967 domain protein n=1 Tax=Cordyceps fumosorosea (strain ARSEF 2679) TaxID=1081104 RepID=A0A168B5V0_CORFA|nr:DUF967 domain protein [Cordyceps fumosorosea ARSEF 2679]OAA69660.1 DUF967 domain protein [Cordyceps fumosorosea ARSEF 2679]
MSQKVWKRNFDAGHGLEQVLAATRNPGPEVPIPSPPATFEELAATDFGGKGFVLSSFTAADAWELGHLIHARLLCFAPSRVALVNIASASAGGPTLYQSVTGSGLLPDHEAWVRRKRAAVLRFGMSSYMVGRKHGGGDEALFAKKNGLGPEGAGEYAIHGGGVPIRVEGAEGIVAVVVVSGLKQEEDHGVIADVIRANWV